MINWQGLRFSVPDGLADETVLTFVAPSTSLTVSQEPLKGGKPALLKYVTDQLEHIKRQAAGYNVLKQTEKPVAGFGAILVESSVQKMVQHQLYILVNDVVVVAAVTAADDAKAKTIIDHFASSFAAP